MVTHLLSPASVMPIGQIRCRSFPAVIGTPLADMAFHPERARKPEDYRYLSSTYTRHPKTHVRHWQRFRPHRHTARMHHAAPVSGGASTKAASAEISLPHQARASRVAGNYLGAGSIKIYRVQIRYIKAFGSGRRTICLSGIALHVGQSNVEKIASSH